MPARRIESEIAVVGAGIAGLTAATTLAARGRRRGRARGSRPGRRPDLEHRDRRRGERARRPVGRALPVGDARPARRARDRVVPELARGRARLHRPRGRAHRYEGHDAPLGRGIRARFRRRRGEARRARRGARPRGALGPPRRRASSTRSPSRPGFGPRSPTRSRAICCAPGSPAAFWPSRPTAFSLLQGLWMIAGAGGTYELFEPDQCLAYRVVGGSQLIPIRLAERLGERVLLDAPAREIRWSADRVEIDAGSVEVAGAGGDRRRSAEPDQRRSAFPRASGLAACAWASRSRRAASTRSSPSTSTPFWRDEGLSGQGFAPYELVRELYDNSPPSASAGVLVHLPRRRERRARRAPERRRAPEHGARRNGQVRRPGRRSSRST